jgi:hypothetical protein
MLSGEKEKKGDWEGGMSDENRAHQKKITTSAKSKSVDKVKATQGKWNGFESRRRPW